MSEPIWFGGETKLDLDPQDMLETLAKEDDIEHVVVVVSRTDGDLTYHSTTRDGARCAFWMQRMLHDLYSGTLTDE